MRNAFIAELLERAAEDERVFLLCGDLGYSVLEKFAQRFPDRFINAGVSEQNMTGTAAGLALCGRIALTYSIANFPTLRCLEQIRDDVCVHNANVKIVAVGGGFSYGPLGYTHYGMEDLGVMRLLPNLCVLAPGDPVEARLATAAMLKRDGPCYLRLGKAGEPVVHQTAPSFEIGRAIRLRDGRDVALLAMGSGLPAAAKAAQELAAAGVGARLESMPTLQPLDESAVLRAARECGGRLVTIEEHGLGGLGTAVAETLAAAGLAAKLATLRLRREVPTTVGSQGHLAARHGLSVENIVKTCRSLL